MQTIRGRPRGLPCFFAASAAASAEKLGNGPAESNDLRRLAKFQLSIR
jgi:hypothetical protein